MLLRSSRLLVSTVLLAGVSPLLTAQNPSPAGASGSNTLSLQAKLVVVPAVVFDKHGAPVVDLTRDSFALTVDGKPQSIRYFDRDTDVPLTVGLLVDISRSVASQLDEEQKASETFLNTMLAPAKGSRPADKAFIMQFAHTAELLQDVTDSRPLLAAGLKEIGTVAPGATDEDTTASNDSSNTNSGNSGSNGGRSGGSGRGGGYGRNGGRGNSGGSEQSSHARGGTVLYDALFLASEDVLGKQTGRRALILLTDGMDRHSKESLTEAIEAAQRADTVVYAIYYKGHDDRGPLPYRGNSGGYGGYDPYGRYPPTTGGSTDPGTYKDPDGKKILTRICHETGGRLFEVKGKGSVEDIYKQIGDELRSQYRLGFTPTEDAESAGYHRIELTLANAGGRKLDIQTREGYYAGAAKAH